MSKPLADRIALVTGASRGIGAAVASAAARMQTAEVTIESSKKSAANGGSGIVIIRYRFQ